jgi:hypothetical protein
MNKNFLAPPKSDERLYAAFMNYAAVNELRGAQVLRKALDALYKHWQNQGERVNVTLTSPMKNRIPTTQMENTRILHLKEYCEFYGITVSQGIREAVALFLGLDTKQQEETAQK